MTLGRCRDKESLESVVASHTVQRTEYQYISIKIDLDRWISAHESRTTSIGVGYSPVAFGQVSFQRSFRNSLLPPSVVAPL